MRRRILVVEDDGECRTASEALLTAWGHEVEAVGDGLEGLERACAWRPDAVVLDLALPGMGGLTLAIALRKSLGEECPVIIAYTGWAQDGDLVRARAAGIDVFLPKPEGLDDLEAVLAAPDLRLPWRSVGR